MDSFGAIPVFVAVVESGGFSPAARFLGISKSAVSKRITQLEQQLGVKLLHRTTRKLSLTEAGEHYFEHAVMANRAAKDAEDAVAQLQGEPQGRLRINAAMSFGRLHVVPMIPAFLKRYPKVSIDLELDDKTVDMVQGGVDIAIRGGTMIDSTLIARKLVPLRSVLCVSQSYLNQFGRPKQLDDLLQHNCLSFRYSNDSKGWSFRQNDRTQMVAVSGNYQANNSEALLDAVLQGVGISRLPTFVVGPYLRSGQLIQLFPEYQMPAQDISAVMIERQYMPAKVRAFLDFAIEYLGSDAPYWEQGIDL
ncbi:LysR family transcriptional regulator [Amphritea japonica]|uniref:LysR family transcriptional regulator n=1 Tax=Amphritea japonica ATCC BAA-1530 TaxID=1278309 RepID=A0A7R6STH7_9GAMM|nr:LysR family transcriptional regulator [Amphritea japonica]BBB27316.1 LysR family transcriptional regulator [Amphritea japonica ATCC BAA-1530]